MKTDGGTEILTENLKKNRYFLKAYFQILLKADVLKGKLYFKPMTQVNKKYSSFLNLLKLGN